MNYAMLIAYDGSRYSGWQRQGNTEHTITGKLEQALKNTTGKQIDISGAGRTDAGVHAQGQCASFHCDSILNEKVLLKDLNRVLPEDIAVLDMRKVPERFHARLSAAGKTYRYRIYTGNRKNVFDRKYSIWYPKELNLSSMRDGASNFCGTHDYYSVCAGRSGKSTIRTIDSILVEENDGKIDIIYHGDGFLYRMVRIITGTLIEIGQGKRAASQVLEILNGSDRRLAGHTAEAKGLTLIGVDYPQPLWGK